METVTSYGALPEPGTPLYAELERNRQSNEEMANKLLALAATMRVVKWGAIAFIAWMILKKGK